MKNRFLFPTYFRIIGILMALPGFILGYLIMYQNYSIDFLRYATPPAGHFLYFIHPAYGNYTDELALALVIVALLFISFARERIEDELIARIRLNALYWAVLINYLLFIIIFVYTIRLSGKAFDHLLIWNFLTPLLIFIIRFNYLLHFKKNTYLLSALKFLPNRPYRKIGITMTIAGLLIFFAVFLSRRPVPEYVWIVYPYILITGLLLWAYSLNEHEDELTMQHRLESMQIAVFVNYFLLLFANFLFYGMIFFTMMNISYIILLLTFVIRFTYISYKDNRMEVKGIKGGLLS